MSDDVSEIHRFRQESALTHEVPKGLEAYFPLCTLPTATIAPTRRRYAIRPSIAIAIGDRDRRRRIAQNVAHAISPSRTRPRPAAMCPRTRRLLMRWLTTAPLAGPRPVDQMCAAVSDKPGEG